MCDQKEEKVKKMNDFFFTEENFSILKKLRSLSQKKREYVIITSGSNLIHAISELLLNLTVNSNRDNLKDIKTIKNIRKNYQDIANVIDNKISLKKKRKILIENKTLQNLIFNICLDGYEYYRSRKSGN